MNRFAKKFRVISGLCVLLNLIALFVPVTRRIQENYADLTWTQLSYIQSAVAKLLPFLGGGDAELTSGQSAWILFFIALPLLLSLTAAVWAVVGSHSQKISSVLAFLVLLLYIGMAATIGGLWPEAAKGQSFERGIGCMLTLVFSGCGAAFALAALIATPRKRKAPQGKIPQVEEIKQQQVEAKYNIMMETNREENKQTDHQREPEHGTLVGIKGIYAGARIPLKDGETILLGRLPSNHLVFEGQASVSRRHCWIRWDAGRQKYIFRDYSSTGSFANGSDDCLPQNLDLELEPGTTVAIGNENNVFCLE